MSSNTKSLTAANITLSNKLRIAEAEAAEQRRRAERAEFNCDVFQSAVRGLGQEHADLRAALANLCHPPINHEWQRYLAEARSLLQKLGWP